MRQDILMDDDLLLENGDWVVGGSDAQHVRHILLNPKGSYKQYPLVGVGEARLTNAPIGGELRRDIQLQLEGDGIRLLKFDVDLWSQSIEIDFEEL